MCALASLVGLPVCADSQIKLFAMPKLFQGHIGIIQNNTVTSWTKLQPRPEIVAGIPFSLAVASVSRC